jgi:hypothetical protein
MFARAEEGYNMAADVQHTYASHPHPSLHLTGAWTISFWISGILPSSSLKG